MKFQATATALGISLIAPLALAQAIPARADGENTLMTCSSSTLDFANAAVYAVGPVDNSADLTFEYSSAQLICPPQTADRLSSREGFTCQGLWSYDWNVPSGQPLDTAAILSVMPNADGSWSGEFTTNHVYGSKSVKLNCRLAN